MLEDSQVEKLLLELTKLTGEDRVTAARTALAERLAKVRREVASNAKPQARVEEELWGY